MAWRPPGGGGERRRLRLVGEDFLLGDDPRVAGVGLAGCFVPPLLLRQALAPAPALLPAARPTSLGLAVLSLGLPHSPTCSLVPAGLAAVPCLWANRLEPLLAALQQTQPHPRPPTRLPRTRTCSIFRRPTGGSLPERVKSRRRGRHSPPRAIAYFGVATRITPSLYRTSAAAGVDRPNRPSHAAAVDQVAAAEMDQCQTGAITQRAETTQARWARSTRPSVQDY
jgi:hypothetical protein